MFNPKYGSASCCVEGKFSWGTVNIANGSYHDVKRSWERDTEEDNSVVVTNEMCFSKSWVPFKKHIIFVPRLQSSCSPLGVLRCFCLMVNPHDVGHCIYACFFSNHPPSEYQLVRFDIKSVSNGTCSQFNREGVLCGQCREGYGPPVYSFGHHRLFLAF